MSEGEAGFLAAILESHGRVVLRRHKNRKHNYPSIHLYLFGLTKPLLDWILEKCPGTKIHGNAQRNAVFFVTAEEASKAFVHAYPNLLPSMKTQAQVFFRWQKIQGRPGIRMTPEIRDQREDLARKILACRAGA